MRQITLSELQTRANEAKDMLLAKAQAIGRDPCIFLHWSAGHYGQPFADYHINIDQNGELYTDVTDLSETLAHTWHNNTSALGVSMLCCAGATTQDLGEEPPTDVQIETMARVVYCFVPGVGYSV